MSAGAAPVQLDLFPVRRASPPVPATDDATSDVAASAGTLPEDATPEPPPADRGDLHRRLDSLLRGRLAELVLTRNCRRIVSVRPHAGEPGSLSLRLDACFAAAGDKVVAAVAAWIDGEGARRRQALAVLRRHFEAHGEAAGAEPPPRRRPALRPVGCRFDLRRIRDDLNREHFDGRLEVAITWGRAPARSRRRRRGRRQTIRLGSYDDATRLVRVHRALDHPDVPRYVVASVVYHEMLHAALPAPATAGRRRLHPPEFRRLEARFPDHERAGRWISRHLDTLLRRR